jgi:branched-chain amino acid transport system ATP-binding protein
MVLKAFGLYARYGVLDILKNVSFNVQQGEIISFLGANGAGKTSILKVISGLLTPTRGDIFYQEQRVNNVFTGQLVRLGIIHVPEGRRLFNQLTVVENLLMGAYLRTGKKEIENDLNWVYELFPILFKRKSLKASTLSGGEQQMLAIGRAMMAKPILLLMDEPTLGLSPLVSLHVIEIIEQINRKKISIILVEQNARLALKIAHRGYVLELGEIIASGRSAELLGMEEIRKAYLW